MKNVYQTKSNFLSGKIEPCGNYAGEFSQEAFDLINAECETKDIEMSAEMWSDIMYLKATGEVIAIVAEGELTSNSNCVYVYLDYSDCPAAFDGRDEKELKTI